MKEGWLRVIVPVLFLFGNNPFQACLSENMSGAFLTTSGNFHFNDN